MIKRFINYVNTDSTIFSCSDVRKNAQRLCHNIWINLKFCLRYVLAGINNKGSEAYVVCISMKYSGCLCISSLISLPLGRFSA